MNFLDQLSRITLISGKGGVGRTSLTAAFGRALSLQGKKTLIAEIEADTGFDSPLARHFQEKAFSTEPQELSPNLFGVSLSARVGQEFFLNSIIKVKAVTDLILSNQALHWFLEGAPAFREMGLFNHFLELTHLDFDHLILDLPATGHMLGLARLPNQLLRLMPVGSIAEKLKEGQKLIYDPKLTSDWIVTLPQALPISEALELRAELEKENIPLGGMIVNRAPFNPFTLSEEEALIRMMDSAHQNRIELDRLKRFQESKIRLMGSQKNGRKMSLWSAPDLNVISYDPLFVHQMKELSP